jgi:2-furoyl-CoA dehydrogenase FAD binding subunit
VKAAPFAYQRPGEMDEALRLLADPGARALAGGQSLVPMMAMRLARPRLLVDLAGLVELDRLGREGDELVIGAGVRQRRVETDAQTARSVPLLAAALPYVGHREIRNRGTVGGSIAHADPAGELLLVAATLGATLLVRSSDGERELRAEDFCTGPFRTRLEPGELLVGVRFPVARGGDGFAFEEVARRHGDYALCGIAVHVRRRDGRLERARVGVMGASPRPVVFEAAEELSPGDGRPGYEAVAASLAERLEPADDVHASAAYRRRLARALAERCLERASAGAGNGAP